MKICGGVRLLAALPGRPDSHSGHSLQKTGRGRFCWRSCWPSTLKLPIPSFLRYTRNTLSSPFPGSAAGDKADKASEPFFRRTSNEYCRTIRRGEWRANAGTDVIRAVFEVAYLHYEPHFEKKSIFFEKEGFFHLTFSFCIPILLAFEVE